MNPITVSALALLPDGGTITNVEFFVSGQKFGEDSVAPFSATWSEVAGGSYRLTAVGQSDAGVYYPSQPVNIALPAVIVERGSVWKYLDDGSDQGTAWVDPSFDDTDDWRLVSETALKATLTSVLAVKLGYEWRYDNQPIVGFDTTDTATTVSLVAKF